MITLGHYLVLASFLFTVGLIGALTRKSAIIVFLSVELMLNSVNLIFLALGRYFGQLEGALFVFFVMAVSAAEAAVGVAITVAFIRRNKTTAHRCGEFDEVVKRMSQRIKESTNQDAIKQPAARPSLSWAGLFFVGSSWLVASLVFSSRRRSHDSSKPALADTRAAAAGRLRQRGVRVEVGEGPAERDLGGGAGVHGAVAWRWRCGTSSRCGPRTGLLALAWGGLPANITADAVHHSFSLHLAPWLPVGDFTTGLGTVGHFCAGLALRAGPLSAVMLFVVTFVGFLIHVYSVGYMAHDKGYFRYFSYLNLFMAMMLTLVLGGNYLVMFIGWEGVGLCSYLLIGFYYQKDYCADAGKKAFLTNRIGDMGFAAGLMLILYYFGTLDIGKVNEMASMGVLGAHPWVITASAILLFVGATGKSAQMPLYVWLPDAMAGPTPVSALIHAATMVTSGVYLVARSNGLYSMSPTALMVVAGVGCLTALFAASIGLVQNDIKKVLAYSTVSQLGYMFLGVGVGAYAAGIFHLYTHAFFKALLFLGSGAVIHAMSGEQDIRKMGQLWGKIPQTYRTFLIGCIAIAGIPPLAGFFSKDEILWQALVSGDGPGKFSSAYATTLFWVGVGAATMTAFYMFRLLYLTFFNGDRVTRRGEAPPAREPQGDDGAAVDPGHRVHRVRLGGTAQAVDGERERVGALAGAGTLSAGGPRGARRPRHTYLRRPPRNISWGRRPRLPSMPSSTTRRVWSGAP